MACKHDAGGLDFFTRWEHKERGTGRLELQECKHLLLWLQLCYSVNMNSQNNGSLSFHFSLQNSLLSASRHELASDFRGLHLAISILRPKMVLISFIDSVNLRELSIGVSCKSFHLTFECPFWETCWISHGILSFQRYLCFLLTWAMGNEDITCVALRLELDEKEDHEHFLICTKNLGCQQHGHTLTCRGVWCRYMCLYVWIWVHVWQSIQIEIREQLQLSTLICHLIWDWISCPRLTCQASRYSPVSVFDLAAGVLGLQRHAAEAGFMWILGNLNTHSYTCMATTLLMVPTLQPLGLYSNETIGISFDFRKKFFL